MKARAFGVAFAGLLAACSTNPATQSLVADPGEDGTTTPDGGSATVDGGVTRRDAGTVSVSLPDPSYEEVFGQGLARYVGSSQVQETNVTTSGLGAKAIDVHHFSGDDRGPICMFGGDFFVETREGTSDTLMIFLQGGGVCLTEICAATPAPILSLRLFNLAGALGIGGLLDPRNDLNPVKDFDVVNAPYCDGSLFAGDVDRVLSDGNPDNGTQDQAYQRGLQNLTATLETARRYFPNPPRIVLIGSSGGAYGVIAGTVMTRYYYPDTPLLVVSDSGAPVVNGDDTDFIRRALVEFNALDMIPKSCPDCLANGHATGVLEWAMRFDPNLSIAYMTHARDHVIGEFFMGTTADQFQAGVVGESTRLIEEFPGRAFRFVIPTSRHTLTMGLDNLSDGLQGTVLGFAGGLGVGFVGDDVTSEELATWSLGGMKETGLDDSGTAWTGYDWLRTLLNDPAHTPNVLQLE